MITERLKDDASGIARAGALLRAGGLVAIPTETVYGLAADALNGKAVARIFAAKGRPMDNPLIVHICEEKQILSLVRDYPENAQKLAKAYWPGPLTIILPKADCIPDEVSAGLDTVAVRFPSHPIARQIIFAAGTPLAAPSANSSGKPSPTNAGYVLADMDGRIEAVLDGGDCGVGVESTVVSLAGEKPRLLRPGGITPEQLRTVLGELEIDPAVTNRLQEGQKAASPGMKYKHYAPNASVTLVRGTQKDYCRFVNAKAASGCFALCFEEDVPLLRVPSITYGKASDDLSQARRLFDALRELDEQGAKVVYAHCPSQEGVGLAVYNRILRAAGFSVIDAPHYEVLGLTGPTGAGKSTAAAALRAAGYAVIDADTVGHEITADRDCLNTLAQTFGAEILQPDGTLNRRALAARAFASTEQEKKLNAITHPRVLARISAMIDAYFAAGNEKVAVDAALLLESGGDALCDRVLSVLAERSVRIRRICARDGITEAEAIRRIAVQQDDAFYQNGSDLVVWNNTTPEKLAQNIRSALQL